MAGIKAKSHYSGHVATYNPASEHAFDEQYHTFNAHGYALNPNTGHDARQTDAHGPGQVGVRVRVRVRIELGQVTLTLALTVPAREATRCASR